eukprot:gene5899-biopygen2809
MPAPRPRHSCKIVAYSPRHARATPAPPSCSPWDPPGGTMDDKNMQNYPDMAKSVVFLETLSSGASIPSPAKEIAQGAPLNGNF